MMDQVDIGWVAGIIEGEGTICSRPRKNGSTYVEVLMTDEDTIQRLHSITEMGHKRGPYFRENRKPFWVWHVADSSDVARLLGAIYPIMSQRRQEVIGQAVEHLSLISKKNLPRACQGCEIVLVKAQRRKFCSVKCRQRFHNGRRK